MRFPKESVSTWILVGYLADRHRLGSIISPFCNRIWIFFSWSPWERVSILLITTTPFWVLNNIYSSGCGLMMMPLFVSFSMLDWEISITIRVIILSYIAVLYQKRCTLNDACPIVQLDIMIILCQLYPRFQFDILRFKMNSWLAWSLLRWDRELFLGFHWQ